MGSKASRSVGSRRLKRLLVLGLIGVGAAVYKASRDAAAPVPAGVAGTTRPASTPTPAPTPASTPVAPVSPVEPVAEVAPVAAIPEWTTEGSSTEPAPDLTAEQTLTADPETVPVQVDEPASPRLAAPLIDALPEPVLDESPSGAETLEPDPAPAVSDVLAADLHDHVEEPWADAQVTPITEPPADSLTSFFDEVLTDTAERKLRKGR